MTRQTGAAPAGADLEAVMRQAALAMARKRGLIDNTGKLWCWQCRRRAGQLPSLLCGGCLSTHPKRSTGASSAPPRRRPYTPTHNPTPYNERAER